MVAQVGTGSILFTRCLAREIGAGTTTPYVGTSEGDAFLLFWPIVCGRFVCGGQQQMSQPEKLERGLGLLEATSLNMTFMVGIGPFIVIPLVVRAMGGPQCILAWIVGAVLALLDGWGGGGVGRGGGRGGGGEGFFFLGG